MSSLLNKEGGLFENRTTMPNTATSPARLRRPRPSTGFRVKPDGEPDRRIQVVKILIEDNFHRKLALTDMARVVNLSPWRLGHLFKDKVGISPQRYLNLVRLQKARNYLETGFLTVREIATRVGMPSAGHFTRSFKAAYGSSPLEHRNAHFRISAIRENETAL
jgi:AraC-like DNA-binding protein